MPIKNATIPDKFLHAIGKVTFNFSGLEYAIKRLTWKLIGISDLAVVDCITANLSFKALTDLASSLLKIRSQNATILQEADTLFKQAIDSEESRNRIIHSYWAVSEDKNALIRIKSSARHKKGHKVHTEITTVAELEKIASHIGNTADSIVMFMDRNL